MQEPAWLEPNKDNLSRKRLVETTDQSTEHMALSEGTLNNVTFTFTFRECSSCFYPKRLTINTFVREKKYMSVGTVRVLIKPSAKR